jgi:response regulator RpfG family c-di-GMP phosphodiesterase
MLFLEVPNDKKVVLEHMKTNDVYESKRRHHLLLAAKAWHPGFDAVGDMVWLIDSEFRVLQANPAAARFLERQIVATVENGCCLLIHDRETPPDGCPHLRAMATGEPQTVEIEEPHLGRTLKISVFPVKDDQGKVVGAVEVISDVTIQREDQQEAIRLTEALAQSFTGITEAISGLAERRDPYTAGHSRGVAEWSVNIAREMGMAEKDIHGLKVCALLHDLGKIAISADILNRSGPLSENEWGIIKAHPLTAYEALCHIDFPWPVAELVYQHHERLDGSGYPRRLKGDEIHPWARILGVADVVDAMITHRPYRPARSKKEIMDELKKGRDKIYDANVVDIALRLLVKANRRLLVVDDEPGILDVILQFFQLTDSSIEVQTFTDSYKALQAFEKQPFPVVITDVNMPGMNGLELLRRVREMHPASRVIIITGLGEKEHTFEALRLGASDFLEKPLQMKALKASVETMLTRYAEQ